MKASSFYFPNPEYLVMWIWWRSKGGREGCKKPIVSRALVKPNERRSEYGCVDTCSLHDHVDDRNGNPTLPLLLKRIFIRGD